jgi:hypothetical protein
VAKTFYRSSRLKRFASTVLFFVTVQASGVFYAFGQEANAPTYKDGDWWKVQVEVSYSLGMSRSGRCDENFAEYMVKIDQGKPKVYGIKENSQEEIQCPIIVAQLFGFGEDEDRVRAEYVKFPLSVGKKWTARIPERLMGVAGGTVFKSRWNEVHYNTVAWEKVRTPKKELEAFKIEASVGRARRTYFYSPEAKAIVQFRWGEQTTRRTMMLVDYNVGQ